MKSKVWLNFFLVLVGIVLGSMVAHVTAGVSFLSWLAFGLNFGTSAPITLELGVVSCTFGINFSLTVATILCIAISLIVGKFIVRK